MAADDAGMGTPNTATAPRPADSTPITQGRQMAAATAVEARANHRARRVVRRSPKRAEESMRASGGQHHHDGGGGNEGDQHGLEQAEDDARCGRRGDEPSR